MEIFIDFGLFELIAAIGLAALSRFVYSKKLLGIAFLAISLAAPGAMLMISHSSMQRTVALLCVATALTNAAVVAAVMQNGPVPKLRFPSRRSTNQPSIDPPEVEVQAKHTAGFDQSRHAGARFDSQQ